MKRSVTTALFSVDDGAWANGGPTFAEPNMSLYEAHAVELGPVRAERMG